MVIKNKKFFYVFILFLFFIVLKSCGNKKLEVVFDIDISVDNEYRLLVSSKTNLPDNTNLLLTLSDNETNTILGQTKNIVKNKEIVFDQIKPNNIGIENGKYKVSISMGLPNSQPKEVVNKIGINGKKLYGQYVIEYDDNKSFKYETIIEIYDSPVQPIEEIKTNIDDLATTYQNLYEELMSFKNDPQFHNVGFGSSKPTPYKNWLEKVEIAANSYTGIQQAKNRLFFSELRQLGMEYMRSKGSETEYTKEKNEELKEIFKN